MTEIILNRTIRPSSHLENSMSYKIDTKAITSVDDLIANINHESKPYQKPYQSEAEKNIEKFQ